MIGTLVVQLCGRICANMTDDRARGVILECLYTGKPIAEIVPEYEKRVDIMTDFVSAFLHMAYLCAEESI